VARPLDHVLLRPSRSGRDREEFVVLLPGVESEHAREFAERVRRMIARDASPLPSVRLSAGVRAAPAPAALDDLVQGADTALYSAKRSGRDRSVAAEGPAARPGRDARLSARRRLALPPQG
jgi:diguanylate cyclase (GGDEF)-like protein